RWVFLPWAWGAPPLACCSRLAIAATAEAVSSSSTVGMMEKPPEISRQRPGSAPLAAGGRAGLAPPVGSWRLAALETPVYES
ncbi:MAG TPA: hypothetical protein PLM24_03495, partial [Methanothrix sp.]|nr:hypothetical protein [Methanothrix sp.]